MHTSEFVPAIRMHLRHRRTQGHMVHVREHEARSLVGSCRPAHESIIFFSLTTVGYFVFNSYH